MMSGLVPDMWRAFTPVRRRRAGFTTFNALLIADGWLFAPIFEGPLGSIEDGVLYEIMSI
jgi:hypothetical protein